MIEKKLKDFSDVDRCPVRNVIDRIGDKWSVLVLLLLEEQGVMRFTELLHSIDTISQKMLTVTLKTLESDGLIHREAYPQIPPKVEYRLSTRGDSLMPHLHGLVKWANDNMQEIQHSREHYVQLKSA